MIDLTVYYFDGTVENIAVQTLGIAYEGGCSASIDHLDMSDVDERGIALTRTKLPTFDRNSPNTFLEGIELVPADRMRDAALVKNGIDVLAFRDKDGEMVPPGLSELFGHEEVRAHIANAYIARLGVESLPASVVEKLIPADDGEEIWQEPIEGYLDSDASI